MKTIGIPAKERIILRAGRLFDGHALVPGECIDIVVEGGVIREIAPCLRGGATAGPGGTALLDLREYTLLPGLVDCHVHLALDGKDFQGSLDLWKQKDLLEQRIAGDLARTVSRGIMAVRDGGDREGIGLSVRNSLAMGTMSCPRIKAAGTALGRKGMYGSFLGPGLAGEKPGDFVKELADLGVDHVKVLASGVVSFRNYRQVGGLQFSEGDMEEIVMAAHGCGIRVMAHASSDEAVQIAVRAGVDSLEHGYFLSEQSLELMAKKGIPWIPTLVPVAGQAREQAGHQPAPGENEVIKKTYQRQQRMVKRAAEMGVRIGVGSDAGASGVLHGEGYMEEILMLEESGLTRAEILRAATSEGALILGLEKEMGTVRPGMKPYLIAIRGNPLEDLNALKNIELIIIPSGG